MKEYICTVMDVLLTLCNLTEYRYQVRYQKGLDPEACLSIAVDDEYFRLTLFYGDNALEELALGNKNWLIYALCHEVSHVYTHRLYRMAIPAQTHSSMKQLEYIREQETERISRLVESNYYHFLEQGEQETRYRKYKYKEQEEQE